MKLAKGDPGDIVKQAKSVLFTQWALTGPIFCFRVGTKRALLQARRDKAVGVTHWSVDVATNGSG